DLHCVPGEDNVVGNGIRHDFVPRSFVLEDGRQRDPVWQMAGRTRYYLTIDQQPQSFVPVVAHKLKGVALVVARVGISEWRHESLLVGRHGNGTPRVLARL